VIYCRTLSGVIVAPPPTVSTHILLCHHHIILAMLSRPCLPRPLTRLTTSIENVCIYTTFWMSPCLNYVSLFEGGTYLIQLLMLAFRVAVAVADKAFSTMLLSTATVMSLLLHNRCATHYIQACYIRFLLAWTATVTRQRR